MNVLDLMVYQKQSQRLCQCERTTYRVEERERELFLNKKQFRLNFSLVGDYIHVLMKKIMKTEHADD